MAQEDFGYMIKKEGQKSSVFTQKPLKVVAVLISVISFILLTLSAYYFTNNGNNKEIQIIHAPNFAIKTREAHSDYNIKNLDKTVYNNIVDNGDDDMRTSNIKVVENEATAKVDQDKVEDLEAESVGVPEIIPPAIDDEVKLPKDDKNVAPTNQAAVVAPDNKTANQAVKNDKIVVPTNTQAVKNDKIIAPTNAPVIKTNSPAIKNNKIAVPANTQAISNDKMIVQANAQNMPNNKILVSTNTQNKIIVPQKIAPAAKDDKTTKYSKVQLGSLRSEELAYESWIKLVNAYPNLFSGLKYFVQKIDFKDKGTFYRLQVGNFKDKPAAQSFCAKFLAKTKKTKSDCIIIE